MKRRDVYYPSFEYVDLHATNYAMGALDLLGRSPERRLTFSRAYLSPRRLAPWLEARDLGKPWTEGNYIVNVGSLLIRIFEECEGGNAAAYADLIETLFDWHDAVQDEATGFWYDASASDLTSAMAGAAHNLHLYYLRRPPRPPL